jgi:hypothetical protein
MMATPSDYPFDLEMSIELPALPNNPHSPWMAYEILGRGWGYLPGNKNSPERYYLVKCLEPGSESHMISADWVEEHARAPRIGGPLDCVTCQTVNVGPDHKCDVQWAHSSQYKDEDSQLGAILPVRCHHRTGLGRACLTCRNRATLEARRLEARRLK